MLALLMGVAPLTVHVTQLALGAFAATTCLRAVPGVLTAGTLALTAQPPGSIEHDEIVSSVNWVFGNLRKD